MTTTSETPLDKRVADYMRKTGADPRRVANLYKITPRMALRYYNTYYEPPYNKYASQVRAELYAAAFFQRAAALGDTRGMCVDFLKNRVFCLFWLFCDH